MVVGALLGAITGELVLGVSDERFRLRLLEVGADEELLEVLVGFEHVEPVLEPASAQGGVGGLVVEVAVVAESEDPVGGGAVG